jgi:ATP-dependent helicase/nuclease subunit B
VARAAPHVLTVPPGLKFADTVVEALLGGEILDLPFGTEPALLADLVIYVPTQRLRPILEAAFAARLAPAPAILPRIRPLGEPGDPLDQVISAGGEIAALDAAIVEPVVAPLHRRFELLPLIERWRAALPRLEGDTSVDPGISTRERLALADALGRLIDEMRILDVPLDRLASVAPPGYDAAAHDIYWGQSREFLRIAAVYWPNRLRELGARDAMDHRLAAIDAEARRLGAIDPKTPIIVLGSTGSVPATARLMRAVARLDHGAVILPGLDRRLDDAGWAEIGAETSSLATRFAHPQAMLKSAIREIGVPREAVLALGTEQPGLAARNRLFSEALRPAESVDRWRETAAMDQAEALAGATVIEAAEEREEALAVAILMRETLEKPEAEVAFVTADRGLAARVAAELRRWHITIEDSAGTPLGETLPAGLLRLLIDAAASGAGGAILALIRHPLARFGFARDRIAALADAFEILVLRGRNFLPALGLADRVRHALAAPPDFPHPAARRISETVRAALPELARVLDQALTPFTRGAPDASLGAFAADLATRLVAAATDDAGESTLVGDGAASALLARLGEIEVHGETCMIAPSGLAGAIDLLLGEVVLPSRATHPAVTHPRAMILGPLESRLVSADRIILGGLNEGVFPPASADDPFLNRAMRVDLGLSPPERRIGQSAHDFMMLSGAPDLYLTRARRAGEQPAIPSRFLRRLAAFTGAAGWQGMLARGDRVLDLARRLDEPASYNPVQPPQPVPVAPRIPPRLSITEIETLRRDPYSIYARHILGLVPLEPIDPALDARERGTILHTCLEEYAREDPPGDPAQAAELLRAIGMKHFDPIKQERELFHFWWERFVTIIPDFVAFDAERRAMGQAILPEVRGKLVLDLASGAAITISGKADRIELDAWGALSIFDYKSGEAPSNPQINLGLAPQLPITGALASRGAFPGVPAGARVAELAHILIGGRDPLENKPVKPDDKAGKTLDSLQAENWSRLERELDDFATGLRAYRSRVAPRAAAREGDYDHLARVAEWANAGSRTESDEETDGEGDA